MSFKNVHFFNCIWYKYDNPWSTLLQIYEIYTLLQHALIVSHIVYHHHTIVLHYIEKFHYYFQFMSINNCLCWGERGDGRGGGRIYLNEQSVLSIIFNLWIFISLKQRKCSVQWPGVPFSDQVFRSVTIIHRNYLVCLDIQKSMWTK